MRSGLEWRKNRLIHFSSSVIKRSAQVQRSSVISPIFYHSSKYTVRKIEPMPVLCLVLGEKQNRI